LKKKVDIFKHPLVLTLCSGLIVGVMGTYLSDRFTQKNLEKQMQLELYKDLIHQQSDFVDHITKDIYCRIYKLSAYCSNLKSGDRNRIDESLLRYKEEAVAWSSELMLYLINLDRYFPREEFQIDNYIIAKELFKDHLDYSFRQVLEKDIQPRFYKAHKALTELDRAYSDAKRMNVEQIDDFAKEVDSLYKRVYEFAEGLSKASAYYKISAKTRLLKENFKNVRRF